MLKDLKAVKAESSGATLPELPVVGAIFRTVHNLHDNTHLDKLGVAHRRGFRWLLEFATGILTWAVITKRTRNFLSYNV